MELSNITIINYKSIEELSIDISGNKGLFGFLGINESGKSNLLKAISLKDNPAEFNYESHVNHNHYGEPIEVRYEFDAKFKNADILDLLKKGKEMDIPKEFINEIQIKKILITSVIMQGKSPTNELDFVLEKDKLNGWQKDTTNLISRIPKKTEDDSEPLDFEFDLKTFLKEQIPITSIKGIPKIIFWKSEDKYLMNKKIDLNSFKTNPKSVSIPLRNCFILSGIDENEINIGITKILNDSIELKNVIENMDKKVTGFVNNIWKEHDVVVGFTIQGNNLDFTVKDNKGKHQQVGDRSDGFRQFVSFLLSSSAEVENGELKDSILLIDEPETHLHPTAQEYLKDELIRISENNIVMFATHSNYLIDKENFSNYYKVFKNKNLYSEIKQFEDSKTTYSEINYVVFNIPTTDYHNELYGWCEENKDTELKSLPKTKKYIQLDKNGKPQPKQDKSLAEYIRHQIHHPENTKNTRYTEKELKSSIEILRGLKYGPN